MLPSVRSVRAPPRRLTVGRQIRYAQSMSARRSLRQPITLAIIMILLLVVLTVGWEITIDSDVLELSLSSVQLGALPIPKHLFINKLQEIGERVRPGKSLLEVFGGRDRRGQDSADMFADELDGYWLDSLWELAENGSLTLADTFKADVDKFARITDVRISDGRIEFDLLPLAMQ